ncbi:MAG TPA: glycosyltransferase [Syntrophobacteria bacterium]|nr:glycosyltransferase [Syntrophobacteria bacterium]
MARKPTFNILMYSHDTYGLGHIRRTLAIASQIRGQNTNILILSGSPIVGRFDFPTRVDFVRVPGMIKVTNEEYLPLSIKIDAEQALRIRRAIITGTAKTFQPDLFVVDKAPLGLKREIVPTLQWLRRCRPQAKAVLGLRDIMDDGESTREDWRDKGVYEILDQYYSEIWVYGNRYLYDPIREYSIPEPISRKMIFTGYIPRAMPKPVQVREVRRDHGLNDGDKLVLVTIGGGGDGYGLLDTFLAMLENGADRRPFRAIVVGGPFLPKRQRKEIAARARRLQVRFYRFHRHMERIMGAADVVVSMGGYNTVSEILSLGKVCLIVPREQPRREQLIRAQVFHQHGLVDYLPWPQLRVESLREKVLSLLAHPEPYQRAVGAFRFTGLEVMRQRLEEFCEPAREPEEPVLIQSLAQAAQ